MNTYALIRDGVVENIIAGSILLPGYECVAINDYAVKAGDTYAHGKFYRDTEEIQRIKSPEEKLVGVEDELAEASAAIVDLEIENAILALEAGM